jgi:hypothetical protein
MDEKELGSYNFAFELNNTLVKEHFVQMGLDGFAHRISPLISNPGKYAMKIQVFELPDCP